MNRTLLLILLCVSACGAAPVGQRVDRLVVYKGKSEMQAWAGDRLVRTYTISTGRGEPGHKQMEGDGRTPEGRYRIDSRHHSKRYHRFLHISYPNTRDKAAFATAKRAGDLPKGATIGGAIGIHGERDGLGWLPHTWSNWTQGCIAVGNDEVEELYRWVKPNAVIVIHP